jgi:hypothetical protein
MLYAPMGEWLGSEYIDELCNNSVSRLEPADIDKDPLGRKRPEAVPVMAQHREGP